MSQIRTTPAATARAPASLSDVSGISAVASSILRPNRGASAQSEPSMTRTSPNATARSLMSEAPSLSRRPLKAPAGRAEALDRPIRRVAALDLRRQPRLALALGLSRCRLVQRAFQRVLRARAQAPDPDPVQSFRYRR